VLISTSWSCAGSILTPIDLPRRAIYIPGFYTTDKLNSHTNWNKKQQQGTENSQEKVLKNAKVVMRQQTDQKANTRPAESKLLMHHHTILTEVVSYKVHYELTRACAVQGV